ncbi:DCC1-like thiol-disulfide oxidoreductase family protein [Halomonas koreensis]|uniref:DCC1-like thiol-disulfide oxidoreductase family protein n=1 Tax=Halomonas koreensis TaxID=245385 RepID=A0ABU1G5R9_9GAMM|nr:DCC1-like thiol-disulfide oxidoreductase family protein [Halomonas koreensis]MDR5867769.1 DCC1-like thiol-disulfide oxidoreductase family protein [Halomonas koreensis]
MTARPALTVYYDAACPRCRRDRRRYERLAGDRAVTWLDVSRHGERLRARGIAPRDALLSLHVEDARGDLHEGLDAYILLMRRVPVLRPLAAVIGWPLIKPALAGWYRRSVRRRLRRQGRL